MGETTPSDRIVKDSPDATAVDLPVLLAPAEFHRPLDAATLRPARSARPRGSIRATCEHAAAGHSPPASASASCRRRGIRRDEREVLDNGVMALQPDLDAKRAGGPPRKSRRQFLGEHVGAAGWHRSGWPRPNVGTEIQAKFIEFWPRHSKDTLSSFKNIGLKDGALERTRTSTAFTTGT